MVPIRASALGGLAVAMLAGPAYAQSQAALLCRATAAAIPVYASGIAETVADIEVFCRAGESAADTADSAVRLSVSVSLNASVTNALREFDQGTFTDAVLIVSGNSCPDPSPRGSTFGSCGAPFGALQDPQFGRLVSAATLEWSDVTIPQPVSAPGAAGTQEPTFRIRGIRANAAQLRLAGSAGRTALPLTASLSVRSRPAVALQDSTVQVGYALAAVEVETMSGQSWSACSGDGSALGSLRLREGFPGALRADASAGIGTGPSRVLLEFDAIPGDVTVRLPPAVACRQPEFDGTDPLTPDSLVLGLVTGNDDAGSGGTASQGPGDSDPSVPLEISEGTGTAVYEVQEHDPALLEDCHIPVRFDAEPGRTAGFRAGVSATLAPRSAMAAATSQAPVPRFAPPLEEARAVLDLAACGTTLLFPFVTNQAGFTTGLVITHGSRQAVTGPLQGRAGSCNLHYYGATSEEAEILLVQYSTQIDPGDQLVFTLSGGNPERNILGTEQFQGYMLARCGFPDARGYAFISDGFGGIADLAMGYLARVVSLGPNGRRVAVPGGPQ